MFGSKKKKSGISSVSSPKSLQVLLSKQGLTEEQKIAKMVKKLELLQQKQDEWSNQENATETTEFDEKVKANISHVRLGMFKNRLPTQKSRASQQNNATSNTSAVSHDETVENARALVSKDDIKRIYLSEGWEGLSEARIKLVVTAISLHNPPGVVKDTFVRLAGIAKLGVVHTAVQIGPIILEWNDSSILIPCATVDWASSKVLLALDMKTLSLRDFFSKYLDPVAEVIANWNGTYMYNEYTNNCQLFSEEILKALEIENAFSGKIKNFLDSISTADTKDLVFKHKFDGESREYEFKTHMELDSVCHEKSDILHKSKDSEDYRLLKAYDRVFWLRYHGVSVSENLAKDKALQKQLMTKFKAASPCFFGDPSHSNTNYPKAQNISLEDEDTKMVLAETDLTYK